MGVDPADVSVEPASLASWIVNSLGFEMRLWTADNGGGFALVSPETLTSYIRRAIETAPFRAYQTAAAVRDVVTEYAAAHGLDLTPTVAGLTPAALVQQVLHHADRRVDERDKMLATLQDALDDSEHKRIREAPADSGPPSFTGGDARPTS